VRRRGTLLKTDAIRKIGFPRKEYFLYGEDLEYSLRFLKFGYRFYWIPTSVCIERRQRGPLSNKIGGIYKEPFRLYYSFRNEVSIYFEYNRRYELLRTLAYAMKVFLFFFFSKGPRGVPECRAVMQGIRDGFRGMLGKNRMYLPS